MKYYDLNGVEFEADDDVDDQEFLEWLDEKWDDVATFFAGEPVQPPVYSDASGQFEQVREQAPLATEELTRSWEPYITGGAARDFLVGSELVARNLAGQRRDAPEDFAGATAAIGVTGSGSTAFSKPTPGVMRSWYGPKDASITEKAAMKKARTLELEGKTKEEIYDETGWWKGEEGEW